MNVYQTSSPEVTVILPVYNAVNHVAEAIRSILIQTFINFELILINDGSADGSLKVMQQFADSDNRINLVSRENRGLIRCLNEALDLAQGVYVARMDADDIAEPDRFQRQLDFLKTNNLDICGASVRCFDQSNHIWHYPGTPEEVKAHLLFDSPFAHPTVMCRTVVMKALKYSPNFPNVEDYDLWQRTWMAGHRGGNLQTILLQYRVHGQQISQANRAQQRHSANLVRQRQWRAIAGLEHELSIQRVLEIFNDQGGEFSEITSLLHIVLERFDNATHATLVAQMFRLAVKAAATSKAPWVSWRAILQKTNIPRNLKQELILVALWALDARPGSRVYQGIKSFYLGGRH